MPDAAIVALDRPSFLAAWVELVGAGRHKPPHGSGALAMPALGDSYLEKRCFDFEERKWANTERLSLVQNMSPPCDKKQIRQVFGLFSYFRV